MDLPEYTPSVSHYSLVYASDLNSATSFTPMVLELQSTRLNLYELSVLNSSLVAHHFNGLSTEYCDPDLIHKSKKAYSSAEVSKISPQRRPAMSLSRFFSKLSTPTIKGGSKESDQHPPKKTTGFVDYSKFRLSGMEAMDPSSLKILRLLNHKADLNQLFNYQGGDKSYTAQVSSMRTKLLRSWSLPELLFFGNATDFYEKPFILRLTFPEGQYLISTFNGYDLVSIFYKMNIARELSFDIDIRSLEPLDYCLPRRRNRRANTTRHRQRSNTVSSVNSIDEEDEESNLSPPPPYSMSPVPEDSVSISIPTSESSTSIARTNSLFSTVDQMTRVSSIESSSSLTSYAFRYHRHHGSISSCFEKTPSEMTNATSASASSHYDDLVFALKCVKGCKPKKIWTP